MQTTISQDVTAATPGQLADDSERHVRSLICSTDSGAPDGINMGLGVFFTSDETDGQCRSAEGASSVAGYNFLGVAIRDASKAHSYAGTSPSATDYDYLPGDVIPVIRLGQVHVYSEDAVDPSKPVYVRVVAAGAEVAGRFRATADSTDCILLEGARWVNSTSAAGVAILEMDFPNNDEKQADIDSWLAFKALGTTAGDLIVCTGAGTYARLAKGTDGQVLKMVSGAIAWAADAT